MRLTKLAFVATGLILLAVSLAGCPLQQSPVPKLPAPPDIEEQAPVATGFAPGVYVGDITETFTVYALGDVAETTTLVRQYAIQVFSDGTVLDVGTELKLAVGAFVRESSVGVEQWQMVTNVVVSDTRAVAALEVAYRQDNVVYQGTGPQVLEESDSDLEFSGSLTLNGQAADGTTLTQIISRSGTLRP